MEGSTDMIKKLKKTISIILVASLVTFGFTACGSEKSDDDKKTESSDSGDKDNNGQSGDTKDPDGSGDENPSKDDKDPGTDGTTEKVDNPEGGSAERPAEEVADFTGVEANRSKAEFVAKGFAKFLAGNSKETADELVDYKGLATVDIETATGIDRITAWRVVGSVNLGVSAADINQFYPDFIKALATKHDMAFTEDTANIIKEHNEKIKTQIDSQMDKLIAIYNAKVEAVEPDVNNTAYDIEVYKLTFTSEDSTETHTCYLWIAKIDRMFSIINISPDNANNIPAGE